MCGFIYIYHDLNVCYFGRPMVNNKNNSVRIIKKNEVATIFTDVTDFDNERTFTSAS